MVVGENAGGLPINVNARRPISFSSLPSTRARSSGRLGRRGWSLAEVGINLAAIAAGIERGEDSLAVGTRPNAYVKRNAFRGLFRRVRAADLWGRLPGCAELLRRKPFHSGSRKDGGQRCGKAEAVGEHVLKTRLAELAAVVGVAIEHLSKDGLGARQVDVALLHRRPRREPLPFCDIGLEAGIVSGIVLLHQAIAVGAGPVKNIVRILIHVVEVDAHGLEQVLANNLGELPSPLGIKVGIRNHIEGRLFGDVGRGHGLRRSGLHDRGKAKGDGCCEDRVPLQIRHSYLTWRE